MTYAASPTNFRNKELLTVADIQTILQIGRTSTYTFLKNPPFRILYINHTIRIPSKEFFNWLDGQTNKSR